VKDRKELRVKKEIELWEEELGLGPEERIHFRENTRNRYLIFLEQVPRDSSLRILDVGAGNGRLSFFLKKWSGGKVYAVDVEVSDRRLFERGGIELKKCNVEKERLPFRDETFDYVICSEVLEHLLYSPFHMLWEIHRVLKNEGILLLSTPNAVRLMVRLKILFGKLMSDYRSFYSIPLHHRHNREWTMDEVRHLLEDCGFVVEKAFLVNTSSPKTGSFLKRFLSKSLLAVSSLSPSWRELIFVRARKGTESRCEEGS